MSAENDLKKTVLEWLALYKIFHYRQNTGAMKGEHKGKSWFVRFAAKGSPDIVCVIGGRYVGIELKAPNGKQSEAQKEFQVNLERAGGFYILARRLEDVTEFLAPIGSREKQTTICVEEAPMSNKPNEMPKSFRELAQEMRNDMTSDDSLGGRMWNRAMTKCADHLDSLSAEWEPPASPTGCGESETRTQE